MHRGIWIVLCTLCNPVQAEKIHFLIPGAAGGGWDLTARATGEALLKANLLTTATFENMSGGGGGRALAHLIETSHAGSGNSKTLMVNSTPIVVRSLQGLFPQSFRDLTPIASVIGDYSVLAVRAQSPVQNLAQLAQMMRADPRKVAIAGGSVRGGTDHIVAAMIFTAMGTPSRQIKYIPYDAGGKAMGGLLSGEVQALSSGYGEVAELFEQGYIRLLCIASEARLPNLAATPTCHEAGAANAFFVNWRGFFAAPNATATDVEYYQSLLAKMRTTDAWKQIRARYGWIDLFRPGEQFDTLLVDQELRLREQLQQLDML